MNSNSLFAFEVDKPAHKVFINMEFDAGLSLVWDAFTVAEILDQWYAPKPMVSRTKYMDFKVGGRRFYAMVSPEGQERWGVQKYTSITPKSGFSFFSAFADENENLQLPGSDWTLSFSESNGMTAVRITIYNESMERMENLMEGFKAGMAATFNNLVELLATLSQRQPQ